MAEVQPGALGTGSPEDRAATGRGVVRAALANGGGAALLAVFAYVTLSFVPSMGQPYWAPIVAVAALYPDVESTRRAALARFLGTTVGSVVGWGSVVWWHHNVLLYGLAVFLAVSLCYLLRIEAAARLAAVAVTAITLVPRSEPGHVVALQRFIEVSYGAACALLYAVVIVWIRRRTAAGSE